MKKLLLRLVMLGAGLGAGAGSALAVLHLRGPAAVPAEAVPRDGEGELVFVPLDPMLAPLVFEDGQLAGYATFGLQLQVPAERTEEVTARLPLIRHSINLTTYRTPLAAGTDGRIPDLAALRKLVQHSSDEALGKGVVRQVAITEARLR